jgi:NADH-quinone oxidoreductase subunit G/NADP-reducing hydrogenase subunit HndD
VRVTLGEEFGLLPGTVVTGKMVTALRKCGFDTIFDVVTGADFTIVEEGSEFLEIIKNKNSSCHLPLFTSCCPAWVLFAEQNYPEILPHLSSAKSPQLMLASLIKNYYAKKSGINPKNIVIVSIMPCTAKKYEIDRKEFCHNGQKDIDFVLTTRELAHLIKNFRIPFNDLPDSDFDPALGFPSGSGLIFGASGGVTESALRTAHFYLTGKSFPRLEFSEVRGIKWIKEASVNLAGKEIKIAVAHGLENARKIVEKVLKEKCPYDFVEIMACPGGCIGGGGQPIPTDDSIRKARIKAIYDTDKKMAIRESHKNPVVEQVYRDFLYRPLSRKAEKLLHTKHYPYKFKFKK